MSLPQAEVATAVRLHVSNMSKTFGPARVLVEVELDVRAGEVHAIVGHNGSGKSTLVKILAGFYQPDPGASAQVDGVAFDVGSPAAAEAAGLRFVHQDLGLVDTMDAVDNVFLGGSLPLRKGGRIDWPAARRQAREQLAALGFEFDVLTPVGALSASQKTAIAVARAMRGEHHAARVVVLDEPTAALPAREVDALFAVVRQLQAQGVGVLYISHHLEEVFALADRVTVLRDGVRVCTTMTSEVDEPKLVELMVGREVATGGRSTRTLRDAAPVLSISDVSAKNLTDVSLGVRPGEVVGVAGVDGSGREELAAVLFGGATRTGRVEVDGETLPVLRPDFAIRQGVGFVPADRANDSALMRMSVLDNLVVASIRTRTRGLRVDRVASRAETADWTERLSIRPRVPETPIEALSGGNQQKVMLARWLRTDPKVLLLDEPTKGVDVEAVAAIWDLVDQAAQASAAVLACSCDAEELAMHCDRVLVLRHGRIVAEVQGSELEAGRLDALAISEEGGARA